MVYLLIILSFINILLIRYFRRLVLLDLNYDLNKELEYVTKIGDDNPKNYQIWYHRKWVVERVKNFENELTFTATQIEDDSKNYHAWAHRQWVVETNNLWEQEYEYIDTLLKADLRNNSAWNQRYFVITKNNKETKTTELIQKEIQYSIDYIRKAPNNQSPWAYLKGLFLGKQFSDFPELKQILLELKDKYITSPHAHSLLLDIYEQQNTKESLQSALQVCLLNICFIIIIIIYFFNLDM